MIIIDGWVSSWLRPSLILLSDSVPIVIESEYTPLYMEFWQPWVHYVPVQSDLSNLIENIEWLKNNDSEAKKIAQNGKILYSELYNFEKMTNDTMNTFKKYKSLMKYEVQKPDGQYLL